MFYCSCSYFIFLLLDVKYESGELHGLPIPKETTDDENEHLCHEKMISDALQVEVRGEVTMDYCIICCQDNNYASHWLVWIIVLLYFSSKNLNFKELVVNIWTLYVRACRRSRLLT
jgi:hypothetical protein